MSKTYLSDRTRKKRVTPADEKKCPQCAEMVKPDAKVCRYCGHKFELSTAEKFQETGKGLMALGCLIIFAFPAVLILWAIF